MLMVIIPDSNLGGVVDENVVHLRAIITNLYMLITQAYDYQGPRTQQAMTDEM